MENNGCRKHSPNFSMQWQFSYVEAGRNFSPSMYILVFIHLGLCLIKHTESPIHPSVFHILVTAVYLLAALIKKPKTGYRLYKTLLASLYWLPVHLRIDFKILLLTCKALHCHTPSHLHVT